MSPGGLKFVSKLEFTVNYLAIHKIRMVLESKNLELNGKIVRKRNLLINSMNTVFNMTIIMII